MIIDANMHYREAMKEAPLYREREGYTQVEEATKKNKKTNRR